MRRVMTPAWKARDEERAPLSLQNRLPCFVLDPNERPVIRVVLVEDHDATRRALTRTLMDEPDRVLLVNSFATAEALFEHGDALVFDVALVDLRLPGVDGVGVIEWLTRMHPNVRAIALTVESDAARVLAAVRAGALGYLLKDEPSARLFDAIDDAAAGRHPFSSGVAGALVRSLGPQPARLLTARELDVARGLASGASYAECAEQLGISVGTLQSHVKSLYGKLDVNSRKELREWASLNLT